MKTVGCANFLEAAFEEVEVAIRQMDRASYAAIASVNRNYPAASAGPLVRFADIMESAIRPFVFSKKRRTPVPRQISAIEFMTSLRAISPAKNGLPSLVPSHSGGALSITHRHIDDE